MVQEQVVLGISGVKVALMLALLEAVVWEGFRSNVDLSGLSQQDWCWVVRAIGLGVHPHDFRISRYDYVR